MQKLIGRQVEVIAGDITYRGILIEIGEAEIYLKAEEGWITVPVERIVDIRAANECK